jgi:hypothetical protein
MFIFCTNIHFVLSSLPLQIAHCCRTAIRHCLPKLLLRVAVTVIQSQAHGPLLYDGIGLLHLSFCSAGNILEFVEFHVTDS